jgi:hypothetical protein
MWDIVAGTLIVAAVSLLLFLCGFAIARRGSKAADAWLALAAVAFILWFALAVHGTLRMASLLPFSAAIVLGNWIPPAAAFLAGIIGGQEAIPLWRRLAFSTMMVSSAWYTNVLNLSGEPPRSHDLWSSRRVCLQTSTSSCSACSAVMLLRSGGIRTDEREMINLCLTGEKGTPPLGLYRGLKAKTADTEWDVEVVRCEAGKLPQLATNPVLLLVTLDGAEPSVKNTARRWLGMRPTADHAVVLYRFAEDGKAVISDPAGGVEPSAGRYQWPADYLKNRWSGEGLRLVRRPAQSGGQPLLGFQ